MTWLYVKLSIFIHSIESYISVPTQQERLVYGAIAFIGGLIAQLFGGWSPLLTLFTILVGADYVTGILASLREGKGIKSSVSFWGLIKKALMYLSILIAHHIDIAMNTEAVMAGSILFWIANELISLTENYGRLGLPMPDAIKDRIAMFKGKNNEESKK